METGIDPFTHKQYGTLKPSLVEWKRRLPEPHGLRELPLKPSLVEWKHEQRQGE